MSSTELLQENMKLFKASAGVSWEELGRRSKGAISGKHIGRIAKDTDQSPTLDALDGIAKAMGVEPWESIVPGIQAEVIRDGSLQKIIETYLSADDEGREFLATVINRESKR